MTIEEILAVPGVDYSMKLEMPFRSDAFPQMAHSLSISESAQVEIARKLECDRSEVGPLVCKMLQARFDQ